MQETWIDGYRADGWTVIGWMLVGIVTCCILMGLVLLWRKTGRIVDLVDVETQTLEEGKRDPKIPDESHDQEEWQSCTLQKRLPHSF